MLKEEINEVRKRLNQMIEQGEREDKIYQVSQELDKLIVAYYEQNTEGDLL